jgi:Fe2+ or Zn2+ uptake regulation protein
MLKERNTKQKTFIRSALKSVRTHPTAEAVHEMIAKDCPEIGIATVYRNLNRLSESGIIRRISVNNSPDRFDGDLTPHYHLCCDECGRFDDFFDDRSQDTLRKFVEDESGFSLSRQETVFYGLCPNCKKEKSQ